MIAALRDRFGALSPNLRGALWMLASALTFTLMTSLVKFLGDEYPPALQTFYRQAAGLAVLLPMILSDPKGAFKTSRPGILIFRSAAGTLGMIFAFYSYHAMPLADANALSFTRTLWIVPLAAFVLREAIGPWRLGATLIGFGGVLLMLQPTVASGFGLPALAALASAFLFALTITGMKILTRDHSTKILICWAAALGFALAVPPALFVWRWPEPLDLLLLALMGVLGLVTQTAYIKGMAAGDAAAMAPIDYTRLIFAVVIGFLFFSEWPNLVTMLGALIIIASTLVITWREAALAQEARREAAVPPAE